MGLIFGALAPILIGFAMAYVLNILLRFYERHYFAFAAEKKIVRVTKKPVCIFFALLTLLGIISGVVWLVFPQLIQCVTYLVEQIPPIIVDIINSQWVKDLLPQDVIQQLISIDWTQYVTKGIEIIGSGIGDALSFVYTTVTSVFSVIVTTVLSVIFAVYMLAARDTLQGNCHKLVNRYMKPKWAEKLLHVLSVMNQCFHGFIVGQCTEAVILGVMCAVGMWIFDFPYVTMISVLVGFTALIPVVGSFIGAGVGFVVILTVSPIKALLFIVFIIVLQQIEGNLIYPKVVGGSIGLPALFVLAAVTVGGSLLGVLGMLLGVPIVATVYRLLKEDVAKTPFIH